MKRILEYHDGDKDFFSRFDENSVMKEFQKSLTKEKMDAIPETHI